MNKNETMKSTLLTLLIGCSSSLCFSQTNLITSKFNFIPGEKVIFFDDFTSESIGDFPLQWNTNGSGEIVTLENFEGRWFQLTKSGYYIPEVRDPFTDNYTIEFDLLILSDAGTQIPSVFDLYILSGDLNNPGYGSQPGAAGLKIKPDYESLFWNNWSEAREGQGESGTVNFEFKPME
jgi:hypothetical protein